MKQYFPCVEGAFGPGKSFPVLLGDKELNPDYRGPDRIMKLGAPRKEFMPKLMRFVPCRKIDIVKKLLDKGTGVNLCSALDETAIGVAVENLHVDNNSISVDLEMFDLPAKPGHKEKTLNKRTAKKKLLPITSAAGSGHPEKVEQWQKMEADPKRRDPDDPAIVNLELIRNTAQPEYHS